MPSGLHTPRPAGILRIGAGAAAADVRVLGKAAALSFSVQENVNIVGIERAGGAHDNHR